VMPLPRVPVELREFAEPALEPGSVLPDLNQTLADAEAMRLPNALVQPQ
jgi:hypothetical protein